MNNSLSSLNCT